MLNNNRSLKQNVLRASISIIYGTVINVCFIMIH